MTRTPFNKDRNDFSCKPDCPDRSADPNCHATCERYLAKRAERDRQNAERLAKARALSYTIDSVRDRQDRQAKKRKNRPHVHYPTH